MKLRLTIAGEEKEVELLPEPDGLRFRFDEVEHTASVAVAQQRVYSILIDGRSYEARVDYTEQGLAVVIDGHRIEIEVRDPRRWSPKSVSTVHGAATLSSPMPGKVVQVLVAVGDAVKARQAILVVEAMKMQNEIRSPRAGSVVSLSAQQGATVAAGEPLATIG